MGRMDWSRLQTLEANFLEAVLALPRLIQSINSLEISATDTVEYLMSAAPPIALDHEFRDPFMRLLVGNSIPEQTQQRQDVGLHL
ncbi:hypothetical protein CCP4SC76_6960002 [Gammaproteobacteria bacterium]